jgi:hypothetical protein
MVGQLVIVFVVPYLERSIERYSRLIKSLRLLHSYKEKTQNVKSFEKKYSLESCDRAQFSFNCQELSK